MEEVFAEELIEATDDLEGRQSALRICLEKLKPADRDLVLHRYYERLPLKEYAKKTGRSVGGLKVTLHRIRHLLQGCIEANLTAGLLGALILLLGVLAWKITEDTKDFRTRGAEPAASGFGVISAESDAIWKSRVAPGKGDLVPTETLLLESGLAQLELFSGVVLSVEGEAEFEVVSSMEVSVTKGNFHVRVPEPARGFRVRLASGEGLELGTEFSMEVSRDLADVQIIQGGAEWRADSGTVRKLDQGESLRWDLQTGREVAGGSPETESPSVAGSFEQLFSARNAERRNAWTGYSQTLRKDDRLLVYFTMDESDSTDPMERELRDASGHGIKGTIVRANRSMDRWGRPFGGLDFSPTGSRVRLTIPGEHRSLTLMCWVKIDSLDRWYNSLFLTDGHELHEPHWQIMDDGRLFFSVKAHDGVRKNEDKHIAYSPPIWTPAQSGQWMHIATAYDGDAATTTHYVNGEAISIDQIPENMQIENVSIGPASIGNWSEPMRDDADFAVRNLNGTMDEFALFSAALPAGEIREMFEKGRP